MKINDRTLVIRATQIVSGAVPKEIQVAPFGKWKGYKRDGAVIEFEVTRELAAKAIEYHNNFNRRYPARDLPIDYEHQTLTGGEAPAAGWYKNLYLKADGIYATVKEWTKKAEEYLRNKEYRYQSPVLLFNDVDGETGEQIPLWISSIALTNSPFLNGIQPVVAKELSGSTIIYLTDSISQPTQGDTSMDDLLQSLRYFLNLSLTATAEEVAAELQKLIKRIQESMNAKETVTAKALVDAFIALSCNYKKALTTLGLPETATEADIAAFALKHNSILQEIGAKATDTIDAIRVSIAAKSAQPVDMKLFVAKSEHDALRLQLTEREFADMIGRHTKRGAVLPAEVEDLKADVMGNRISCKDLDARMAKRADYSQVPLQEIEAKNANQESAIDAVTLEIASKAGVSVEDIKKYGK